MLWQCFAPPAEEGMRRLLADGERDAARFAALDRARAGSVLAYSGEA